MDVIFCGLFIVCVLHDKNGNGTPGKLCTVFLHMLFVEGEKPLIVPVNMAVMWSLPLTCTCFFNTFYSFFDHGPIRYWDIMKASV